MENITYCFLGNCADVMGLWTIDHHLLITNDLNYLPDINTVEQYNESYNKALYGIITNRNLSNRIVQVLFFNCDLKQASRSSVLHTVFTELNISNIPIEGMNKQMVDYTSFKYKLSSDLLKSYYGTMMMLPSIYRCTLEDDISICVDTYVDKYDKEYYNYKNYFDPNINPTAVCDKYFKSEYKSDIIGSIVIPSDRINLSQY